ncbi:MAG: PatB family C-S lyase [Anaerolineales bacterium]
MSFDPSQTPNRRTTKSIKWTLYPEDVIPLWVADTDFPAPAPILNALRAALEHGVLGYEFPSRALKETVAARMETLYGWKISPEAVVATPGIIAAFNAAAWAFCQPGDGFLIQPPVYPPFFGVSKNLALTEQQAPLQPLFDGAALRYEIDFDVFRAAFHSAGAKTRMFLLCNPHNPVGRAFSADELRRMAEICLENDTLIVSDEIHSELTLGATRHTPIAALSPEIEAKTITLIAPSKTYNVPGLFCGFAIIPNPELREKFKQAAERLVHHVSSLSLIAAQSAYSGACDDWLNGLRAYLTESREILLNADLPGLRLTTPEATYMAWLDASALVESGKISGSPQKFFLHNAKVALSEGADFGPGQQNFVRLVFGCSHDTLRQALARLRRAL